MRIWLLIGSTYADWLVRRTFDLICDERTYFRLISAIDGYCCWADCDNHESFFTLRSGYRLCSRNVAPPICIVSEFLSLWGESRIALLSSLGDKALSDPWTYLLPASLRRSLLSSYFLYWWLVLLDQFGKLRASLYPQEFELGVYFLTSPYWEKVGKVLS